MKQIDLVKLINSFLKESWSQKEVHQGKEIRCMPSWSFSLREVIRLYREKGWIVERKVSISSKGRSLFLSFKNPNWSRK